VICFTKQSVKNSSVVLYQSASDFAQQQNNQ
jgi:hypothetical protein